MPSVYLGRFNRFIEKLFNVKGGPTIVDIEPGIRVTLPLRWGQEDRVLSGWNRFAGTVTVAGVAAQQGSAQLRNPSGSNVVTVIEKITARIGPATASNITLSVLANPSDFGTVATQGVLDNRVTVASSMVFTGGTPGATGANSMITIGVNSGLNADFITTENQEIPLLPGLAYRLTDSTVNEQLFVSIMWRERAMESSETSA